MEEVVEDDLVRMSHLYAEVHLLKTAKKINKKSRIMKIAKD